MCSCMGNPMVAMALECKSTVIALKELLPVLLSCWGKEWSVEPIRCNCDNMAVVEVLNSGYSRDREMMHLLRCLFFIAFPQGYFN